MKKGLSKNLNVCSDCSKRHRGYSTCFLRKLNYQVIKGKRRFGVPDFKISVRDLHDELLKEI